MGIANTGLVGSDDFAYYGFCKAVCQIQFLMKSIFSLTGRGPRKQFNVGSGDQDKKGCFSILMPLI